jgi:hypothetical protein
MGNNPGDVFCLVRAVSVEQSKLLLDPIKKTDFVVPNPTKSKIIISVGDRSGSVGFGIRMFYVLGLQIR